MFGLFGSAACAEGQVETMFEPTSVTRFGTLAAARAASVVASAWPSEGQATVGFPGRQPRTVTGACTPAAAFSRPWPVWLWDRVSRSGSP